jgi:hypothetical protein
MSLAVKFRMTNEGWTQAKWHKKDLQAAQVPEGACFGYSLLWLKALADGKAAAQAKPAQQNALILQAKVETFQKAIKRDDRVKSADAWDKSVRKTITEFGVALEPKTIVNDYKLAPKTVTSSPGLYLVDIGHHWVAMAAKDGAYLFFDPNFGCVAADKPEELAGCFVYAMDNVYAGDSGFTPKIRMYKLKS